LLSVLLDKMTILTLFILLVNTIYISLLIISTNNIAKGMVRGSQVRFQSTKSIFSILKAIYVIMPPLSDLPIRFSFCLSFLTCSAGRTCYLWHHCFRNPWRKALISSSMRLIGAQACCFAGGGHPAASHGDLRPELSRT
jgi:hypothetical protein